MGQKGFIAADIPTPIELVLLLQDLEYGGTQRYATHLLKNLDRNLFSPKLWVLRGGTDMAPMARQAGVEVHWLSKSCWVGPVALSNLAWRLARERPHILYTLTVVPNIWGRLFGTMTRVPVIVSSWRDLFPQQYEALMWRLSTRIITNSAALKQLHTRKYRVDSERVAVVPNGVEPEFFTPDCSQKAAEPTVLFVGRLARIKDPFTLLEGFRHATRRIPEAKLEILGNGRLGRRLESFVRQSGLENRVRLFHGARDIRPYLRRAWVFALSSKREASPNVILEAMASELPIVAPRVGGIPELVAENETGITFEPGNPEALADALTTVLENESLRLSMGRKGRERVMKHYTMERMISETEKVLIEAVRQKLGGKTSDRRKNR